MAIISFHSIPSLWKVFFFIFRPGMYIGFVNVFLGIVRPYGFYF